MVGELACGFVEEQVCIRQHVCVCLRACVCGCGYDIRIVCDMS